MNVVRRKTIFKLRQAAVQFCFSNCSDIPSRSTSQSLDVTLIVSLTNMNPISMATNENKPSIEPIVSQHAFIIRILIEIW